MNIMNYFTEEAHTIKRLHLIYYTFICSFIWSLKEMTLSARKR